MASTDTERPAGSAESRMQVAILLVIGCTAGAASFTHVHDLAVKHGQPEWIGWADAIVLELMSIALGLEIRRRRRAGTASGRFVGAAIGAAALLSLSAQVAGAEFSFWGWVMAGLPAAAFLVLVKMLLSRPASAARVASETETVPPQQDNVPSGPVESAPVPAEAIAPAPVVPVARTVPLPPLPVGLLDRAHAVAADYAKAGRTVDRDGLRAALGITAGQADRLLVELTGAPHNGHRAAV
ncbi:DUF2637 domain-containing protein [Actinocatenispora comari]|uniref:SpdA protein n=1 Tax=Actinocatenispora comari TaxID=2807577 RepID=A0A8J4EIX4_9ACTN|nr:DUF2637 domain-containing protein [Actinocatenispora comari]GIL25716.1 SpdA protein [Actinocatenispora comari]